MDKEIDIINEHRKNGMKFKDIARKGDEFIDDFKKASDSFFSASNKANELLNITDKKNINFIIRTKALANYYTYEAFECLYAYEYKNGFYEKALENAKKARESVENAIQIVDDNLEKLNGETSKYLIEQQRNWKLSQLTVQLRELEPIGQKAMKDADYVTALDSYKQMEILQEKAHKYVEESDLPEVFKRTERGNYFANKASTAMTYAGIYTKKSDKNNYNVDIIKQFLIALVNIKKAQENNPEQDRYKEGSEATINNIKNILLKNKDCWFDYLNQLDNDNDLIKLMKETDNDLYKMESAKSEIENNKLKQLILTFSFYFSAFIILGYLFYQIALSEISWYRFLILIVALPVFFTIIGAFALRSTDSLKEENFLELMRLAFRTNLSGLKILTSKDTENESEE
jgi:hypothetical protein